MASLELYDYGLPEELIAQYPSPERAGSHLLVVDRASGELRDRRFMDIPEYLKPGDVLVMNDSRVIPARLLGLKETTGAHIEIFLLREESGVCESATAWKVLARPARRLKQGERVVFSEELSAQVLEKHTDGSLTVAFEYSGVFLEVLERTGRLPLPPYIKREAEPLDSERYQTVYAKDPGSAAAPTAGLHFSEELLKELVCKGVQTEFVTLHVGLGTFRPVKVENIEDHQMHKEYYHIGTGTAGAVSAAKSEGRRVICVGTTSVRTLESAAKLSEEGEVSVKAGWGSTDLFIYPGSQRFLIADALITNFHLPKSSLLMLVAAFYGRKSILEAYQHAVNNRYRFFSYGDAMLIL